MIFYNALLNSISPWQRSVPAVMIQNWSNSIAQMVLVNEHKRRQSAPGIRISQRAFGKDRRYPITSAYRKQL